MPDINTVVITYKVWHIDSQIIISFDRKYFVVAIIGRIKGEKTLTIRQTKEKRDTNIGSNFAMVSLWLSLFAILKL